MKRRIAAALVLIALFALVGAGCRHGSPTSTAAGTASLPDGRPFDPVTGRDTRNYPPDPQVRYEHIKLDLRFDDLSSRSFVCTEELSFQTTARPIERLTLDAVALDIQSVTDAADTPLAFEHDGRRLTVRFPSALPPATRATLRIRYECREPQAGMIFALPDEAYPDRPLMVHTQGEPQHSREWFVCHDYPNARCTTEIIVTLPAQYKALANGRLVERRELDDGMVLYHYRQDQPHTSYLVSLVLGELEVVREQWRGRPVEYWVPPHLADRTARTFAKTPAMLDFFSDRLHFEYPFAKYAQAVVYLFQWGGMENTSATTLYESCLLDEKAAVDQDIDGLIAHELAHQWFGDTITCRSWEHIWLNEGFATFMTAVWFEHERGADDYAYGSWSNFRSVAADDRTDLISGVLFAHYDDPWDIFGRSGSNPYSKGSAVLRMLRHSLGDEVFWECIRAYVKRHAWTSAETADLRRVVEEVSGRSYERFFRQWLHRPGSPHISVRYEWDAAVREARVMLEQTQEISQRSPAFVADVDVWLVDEQGGIDRHVLRMDSREVVLTVPGVREPAQVCVDPKPALLAKWAFHLPMAMRIHTAGAGPTLGARLHAVASLAGEDRDDARAVLRSILLDESEPKGLRTQAAEVLGSMQAVAARDILLEALALGRAITDHGVRTAVVAALGQYRGELVIETLIRFARHDATYSVEAAAARALGNQDPCEAVLSTLLETCRKPSWNDQLETAAVEALGTLGDPRGLEAALHLARYGRPYRSRPAGIAAIGKIGGEESVRDEARRFLIDLLNDPQDRAVNAAIDALGSLGDARAIAALEQFADRTAYADRRRRALDAVESLRERD